MCMASYRAKHGATGSINWYVLLKTRREEEEGREGSSLIYTSLVRGEPDKQGKHMLEVRWFVR